MNPKIELTSLIQALKVAEHLSFRRAAEALGICQSSVSKRVRTLENLLGVDLFDYVIQRLAALHQRPDIRRSPVARDTFIHLVGLGKGISLTSEPIIAMPFPHVAFRPIAGNSDIVPFSGVWLLRNSNQALRRFISLARTLSKTWNAPSESAVQAARKTKSPR